MLTIKLDYGILISRYEMEVITMTIALYHKHYDENHLAEVKEIMKVKGAPVIRAIWSDIYGMWMAIEGCHRIRAAKELGIIPVIKDISKQKHVTLQSDGYNTKVSVSSLLKDLTESAYKCEVINFEEE